MKHLCFVDRLFVVMLLFSSVLFASSADKKSAIVYYGDDISWSLLGIHDYIILQPKHVDTASHGFDLYKDRVYAYLSVGEVEKEQDIYSGIDKNFIIGENKIWKSKVVDVGSKRYQHFFFSRVIEPLRKKGFRNFFLDTLDSYTLVSKKASEKERMRKGLISLINEFHRKYPESKLIINRGFEIINEVHNSIEAVLFESLFKGLGGNDLQYTSVSAKDRKWLLSEVKKIKKYNLPVIAVDYMPLDKKESIQELIKKIESLNIIPYIADKHLLRYGYSSKKAFRREVLLLYDDTEFLKPDDDKIFSTPFQHLSMPLEYMGYIPVLTPITSWKFKATDKDRYAAAVVWVTGTYTSKNPKKFTDQVSSLYHNSIKMLILDSIDTSKHRKLLSLLGISAKELDTKKKAVLKYNKEIFGFEAKPFAPSYKTVFRVKNADPLCSILYGGEKSTISAVTPWGGYAFDGAVMLNIKKEDLWIANPFKLLTRTLRLESMPVPDVTTENGKRLLFSHIDGDAIMNRAEWNPKKFSGEVIYEQVLSKYKIPISVSIVEAEIAPYGLFPKISSRLEKIAKKIYALSNIEAATHTYSHPFVWGKIENGYLDKKYRLPVKDNNFSVDREIRGSLDFINKKLEPEGKSSRTLFWSGDCVPTKSVLEYVYKNNFLQMNGGDTTITYDKPWLTHIAPLGIRRGNYYQVFTGAENENVYTNDWHGPFWGYRKVIQTFELTNAPRRYKPIDIYYHFYSASKRASLKSLKRVYDWAISQDANPIFASEYIPKVMDFYDIAIGREENGWIVTGARSLKTLRVPAKQYVDYNFSKGIVGDKKYLDQRYLHLSGGDTDVLRLSSEDDGTSRLLDANGMLKFYSKSKNNIRMGLVSSIPLNARFFIADGCRLDIVPAADKRDVNGSKITVFYNKVKDANVTISCK